VGHSEPSLLIYRDFESRTFPDTLLYQKTGQPTAWPDGWEWPDASKKTNAPQNNKTGGPAFAPGQQETVPNGRSGFGASTPSPGPSQQTLKPASAKRPTPKTAGAKSPIQIAEELLDHGRIEEAIALLQQQVADEPNSAAAHALLGRAYANQGRWTEAKNCCQKAIGLDSLHTEAYDLLASIYQHEGQLAPAIGMYKKVIYLDRQAPLPHFNLAALYRKTGQHQQARRSYQNVVNILDKWPPDAVVPDSGGSTAHHLVGVARRMVEQLK
jgi:chemotaxis protein methyltransferase CheR